MSTSSSIPARYVIERIAIVTFRLLICQRSIKFRYFIVRIYLLADYFPVGPHKQLITTIEQYSTNRKLYNSYLAC